MSQQYYVANDCTHLQKLTISSFNSPNFGMSHHECDNLLEL